MHTRAPGRQVQGRSSPRNLRELMEQQRKSGESHLRFEKVLK